MDRLKVLTEIMNDVIEKHDLPKMSWDELQSHFETNADPLNTRFNRDMVYLFQVAGGLWDALSDLEREERGY